MTYDQREDIENLARLICRAQNRYISPDTPAFPGKPFVFEHGYAQNTTARPMWSFYVPLAEEILKEYTKKQPSALA